jgi:hypothetical protein
MRSRSTVILAIILVQAACGQSAPGAGANADTADAGPDTSVPPGAGPAGADSGGAADEWPTAGPVDYRREHAVDLTADGRSEMMVVTARGPAYDSLDIALTIHGPDGDTLWHEAWPSLLYFKYDVREGKADSTVMRIVRDHVAQLLARDRFNMQGGLPAVLQRAGDPDAIMREAIHYHLAELDWRRREGLAPTAATPPDGFSEISTAQVEMDRVDAVLAEVRMRPSYMYYAGGEATYAIAWSDRENAFVRTHSCC